MSAEVRRQVERVSSRLPPYGPQGSISVCQAWQEAPLATEPYAWPNKHCFKNVIRQNRVDKQLHMKQVVKILRCCTKVQTRAETTAETQEAREV